MAQAARDAASGGGAIIEAHLLCALAHRALGDQRATNHSVECALALAEPDQLVLPFAMTGAWQLWCRCRGTRQRTPRC